MARQALPGEPFPHAFFLDVDGTLVAIAEEPRQVSVAPRLVEVVRALHEAAGGALALVSGRTVAGVDALFAPLRLPVAGQHGAERRDADGTRHIHDQCAAQLQALRDCVTPWAARTPGVLLEDKGLSLAVHFRRAPQREGEAQRVLRECLERTGGAFRLQPGKMVLELKPAGRDKGRAIQEFMAESPFAGRVPVFIGDDATDEHGFAVVNDLNGYSVKVGPGPTAARWRLSDARAVCEWLESLL